MTFGVIIPELGINKGFRISDLMSVFTAEMQAIVWTLWGVEDNRPAHRGLEENEQALFGKNAAHGERIEAALQ